MPGGMERRRMIAEIHITQKKARSRLQARSLLLYHTDQLFHKLINNTRLSKINKIRLTAGTYECFRQYVYTPFSHISVGHLHRPTNISTFFPFIGQY